MVVQTDHDSDSVWWDKLTGPVNNELYTSARHMGCRLTLSWNVDYYLNDKNNTMMLYIDAVPNRGITNFVSTGSYKGDYPKNNRFRSDRGIDLFVTSYDQESPTVFLSDSNLSVNITTKTSHVRERPVAARN
jgi:hypothetical protein